MIRWIVGPNQGECFRCRCTQRFRTSTENRTHPRCCVVLVSYIPFDRAELRRCNNRQMRKKARRERIRPPPGLFRSVSSMFHPVSILLALRLFSLIDLPPSLSRSPIQIRVSIYPSPRFRRRFSHRSAPSGVLLLPLLLLQSSGLFVCCNRHRLRLRLVPACGFRFAVIGDRYIRLCRRRFARLGHSPVRRQTSPFGLFSIPPSVASVRHRHTHTDRCTRTTAVDIDIAPPPLRAG